MMVHKLIPWIPLLVAPLAPAAQAGCPNCVVVAVDMDATLPGFQTTVAVAPGTATLTDVTLWLFDPTASATIHSIGYIGALNRGIAFGHVPDKQNGGAVVDINATAVGPAAPGHDGAFVDGGTEPMFAGPEIQYFDGGADPATIPAKPPGPILTVDIELANTTAGDVFTFHVGDMTATWLAGQAPAGGAFSTTGINSLDAGGDACPDGTVSVYGIDADVPASVPPAPFCVDYIDGGGATIVVQAAGVPAASSWALAALACGLALYGAWIITRRRTTQIT